jgi:SWI/SNF-related matrix-associated actin-dependent regulator 1 of chromatin subfamily A
VKKKRKHTTPYKFQAKDLKLIKSKFGCRALVAWDMGLGKTPLSLWIARDLKEGPVVVICPAQLKWQWQREALKHAGMRLVVLEGRVPKKGFDLNLNRNYVINYDILGRPGRGKKTWLRWLKKLKPRLVIIDEVQYIKNPQTIRTKAVRELCEKVKHVVGLGGTGGLENCPAELFPFLNICRPDVFDSFYTYAMEFCEPRRTPWGWQFKGATNLDKLHMLLKETCMVRRRKVDVLKDLPKKTRTVIPVDIKRRAEYVQAQTDFIRWLMRKSKRKALRARNAERLVQLGYLKRLAAELKMKAVCEWIDAFIADNPGKKLLVFGVHKKILHLLHERYKNSVLVTGEVVGRERQVRVDKFNRDKKCQFFFGNIDAAGVGWSCTSTSTVLFVELSWTPGKHMQAEDRVVGIKRGLKGEAAQIFYLVARATIEEMLCQILEKKQKVIDQILDGKKAGRGLDVMSLLEERLMGMAA